MKNEIWMGLINIKPLEDNGELNENEEAYTSVLLFATDEDDYETRVRVYLAAEKFGVISVDEVVNYTDLLDEYEFDEDVDEAAAFLESTKKPQMTVLQIYNKED